MSAPQSCLSCVRNTTDPITFPQDWIAWDDHWRVGHATGSAIVGWLVLIPRRHVVTIAELSDAEAASLGTWQVRLSRALHSVTGCAKTYVVQFAERAGFEHVHFHVVPRADDLPPEARGPRVFSMLGKAEHPPIDAADVAAVAARLRESLIETAS